MTKNDSGLGIELVDEQAQVYFDLEDKIPAEDIERYKAAMAEEDVLAQKKKQLLALQEIA